ncbi:hypothetical protein DFH27DRAFT_261797 [Peziza echinospora]|nr:hypothetical protein DFH27DRAFT_261797 [Peziza echinospora]
MVMAQQNTVNVESQVGQSVVPSTTDDDASKTATSLTTGEKSSDQNQTQPNRATKDRKQVGDGGSRDQDTQKTHDDSRTTGPGINDEDNDLGSGDAGSPNKAANAEGPNKTAAKIIPTKKPQSFKAVSITRNFLEKTTPIPTVQAPSKLVFSTDRSSHNSANSATALSSAKPRLVSKSTTGLRDSSSGGGFNAPAVGAKNIAEATRAVWNKNQPPPIIPEKELSDEELKRKFGIHLASRLQSDEVTGTTEAKWADEDDDDDWVPEAIEWNDGTKVELQPDPPAPTPAVHVPEPTPIAQPPAAPTPSSIVPEVPKPVADAVAHTSGEIGSGRKMLAFSRDSRKNTELAAAEKAQAKDTQPARASPWAPVIPVQPVPLGPTRVEPKVSDHGVSQHARAPSREVPTDEYSRPWRAGQANSRELFNSETGQLEPVQDGRNRGPRDSRPDTKFSKAQVLQRPLSQISGPAEPSAAFQQSRAAGTLRQDDYRRRRTSSNVSGGSGSAGRRLSFNKGVHNLDHPLTPDEGNFPPRPLSRQIVEATAPAADFTPVKKPTQTDPTSVISEPTSQPLPVSQPTEFEDPVVLQQAIMKDAREKARRRKQEEEELESAARKERLRVKLEALERQAAEKAAKEKEKQEAEAKAAAAEKAKAEAEAEAARQASLAADAAAKAQAEANIESSRKADNNSPAAIAASPHTPVFQQQNRQGSYSGRSPSRNLSGPHSSELSRSPIKTYVLPANRDPKDSQWKNTAPPSDRFTSWGNNNKPQTSNTRGSPWGPVGDKSRYPALDGVRNGTFDTPQYPPYPHQESSGGSSQNLSQSLDSVQPSVNTPGTVDSDIGSPTASHAIPSLKNISSAQGVSSQQNPPRPQIVNQWASYPAQLQKEEAEERLNRKLKAQEELGRPVELPTIVETWRKVEVTAEERSLNRIVTDQSTTIVDPGPQTQSSNGYSGYRLSPKDNLHSQSIPTGPSSTRQTSRFFPGPQTQHAHQPQPQFSEDAALARLRASASPPPPTCPVNDVHGDRPVPSVRLPPIVNTGRISPLPRSNGSQKSEVPKSPRVSGLGAIEAVQQNIQAILQKGKEHQQSPTTSFASPVKTREMSVTSSTKPVYDEGRPSSNSRRPAAVTLPPNSTDTSSPPTPRLSVLHPEDACTKPDEDDFISSLYVQDFGSQPTVKLSNVSPHKPFIPPPSPHIPKGKFGTKTKLLVNSIPILDLFTSKDFTRDGSRFIPVRLPGLPTTIEAPFNFPVNSQPRPKKARTNDTSRNKRGSNSYSRDGQSGGFGGNGRGSFRTGPGRSVVDIA